MVRSGSSRTRFIVGVAVLFSLTLLAAGARFAGIGGRARDAVAPLRKSGKSVTGPIDEAIAKLSVKELRADNARLRRELDTAKADAGRYRDAVRQRKELLALLNLTDAEGQGSVAARVVDVGLGLFDDRVVLDVGANRGVVVGAPVVTGAGLVGRVVLVSQKQSSVLLISDPLSSVGVRLSSEGDVGIAKGTIVGEPLRVDLISSETTVVRGDIFVTSGLQGSVFPPGIPVGAVRTVKSGAIQKEITMSPLADLKHLEFVKVLLTKPAANTSGSGGAGQ